jgi:predicted secreted protein
MERPKISIEKVAMNFHLPRNKILCYAAASLLLMTGNAFAFWTSEKLNIQLPVPIEDGGIVPVLVEASGFSADPVIDLTIAVDSNPPPYQQAMKIRFAAAQPSMHLSSRVRFATLGAAKLSVTLTHVSGKQTNKVVDAGPVKKAVDFSKQETLDVVFQGGFKFPSDEVGQPMTQSQLNPQRSGFYAIRSRLHHPMLPPSAEHVAGFFVNKIEFLDNNVPLATVEASPVMTNDPFIQLDLPLTPTGGIQVRWTDTKGLSFIK